MSQHDLIIANQTFPNFRSDLNLGLQALGSTSIGSSAPSTIYSGQMWIDNSGSPWILYVYDGTDSIKIGEIDTSANSFSVTGTWDNVSDEAANFTVDSADNGNLLNCASSVTVTLPAGSTLSNGFFAVIRCDGAGPTTINRSGSDTIPQPGNNAATSMTLYEGESVLLMTDAATPANYHTMSMGRNPNKWNATVNGQDNTLQRANLLDYGVVTNALGDLGGGTDDIDLESGNAVSATVSTSTQTFTFSNPTASDEECGFVLYLTNGGSQTVNWPASVDWAGGTAPTLTTAGLDVLVFSTIDGGTIWHGAVAIADSK